VTVQPVEASFAIQGSATRQDGKSASLTAPSGQAQRVMLRAALGDAGIGAEDLLLFEAAANGSPLGDPIEVGAVASTLPSSLLLANGKGSIGHSEPSSGHSGLALLSEKLMGSQQSANAQLRVMNRVVGQARKAAHLLPLQHLALPSGESFGGVSAFGYSGTIASIMLSFDRKALDDTSLSKPSSAVRFKRRALPWRLVAHPLVQSSLITSDSAIFRSPVAGPLHATVADHVIEGGVVFPGVAYLELARAAHCATTRVTASALSGVFFLQPLLLGAPDVYVYCTIAGGRFDICSGGVGAYTPSMVNMTIHSSGSAEQLDSALLRRVDLAAVRSFRTGQCVDVPSMYLGLHTAGAHFGPSFRRLDYAWRSSRVCLGKLRRRVKQQGAPVHPGDLDAGVSMKPVVSEGPVGLPFAMDEALMNGSTEQRLLWAAMERTGDEEAAVRLGAQSSQPRAQIDGFKSRATGGAATAPRPTSGAARTTKRAAPSVVPAQAAACDISLEAVLEMVRRTVDDDVDADAPLMEAGVDSLGAVELRNQLQRAVGESVRLSSTLMFDFPTAREVIMHLQGSRPAGLVGRAAKGNAGLAPTGADVEVAGICMKLPKGVSATASLLEMSHCGCDLLCVIPSSRWDVEGAGSYIYDFPQEVQSRVRHGAFMRDAELFQNGFFAVSSAEAMAMDPQQRQLLERGYGALHAAGMTKGSLLGAVVAVNVGQWQSEFDRVLQRTPAGKSVYVSTGYAMSVTCGRVSFALGMQGPCATIDTACSASLVANHSGTRALQRVECDAALSAGVNMILEAAAMIGNAIGGFTSVRGRSHTWDTRADGYARGEAVDTIVCQLSDGGSTDNVLGSAVRQDGRSASLTAPNGQSQQGLLMASLADAGLIADEAASLEAHGTGTALGDPIEAGSMAAVILAQRSIDDPYVVGSLKANGGHMEPGAGLAGVFNLLMQLRDEAMSPNAHLRLLNPHVAASLSGETACALPTSVSMLKHDGAVRGGVNSFGYAGTIAHAMLRHLTSSQTLGSKDAPGRTMLSFKHSTFGWVPETAAAGAASTSISMYAACWAPTPPATAMPSGSSCVLMSTRNTTASSSLSVSEERAAVAQAAKATRTREQFGLCSRMLASSGLDESDVSRMSRSAAGPTPAALASCFADLVTVVFGACETASAPVLCATELLLALPQVSTGRSKPLNMLLLTSGTFPAVNMDALQDVSSAAATGGSWGFARVLRMEVRG
jgi:3-oxoacyl-(acyl-carrier-protein) synthase